MCDATVKHRSQCVTVLDVSTNNSSVNEPDLSVIVSDLVLARNCCLARMLPGEAELVSD